jgi:hypothetical protein
LPLRRDVGLEAEELQQIAGLGRVVAAVEVQALTGIVTMIGPLPQHPDLHGCDQFPRQVQRDAVPVGSRPA